MEIEIVPLMVLLIGDSKDDYLLVRDCLRDFSAPGSQLKWAADYDAALDALRNGRYEVCLFDCRLGDQGARRLLEEVDRYTGNMPIVFLTGREDRDHLHEAMTGRASDYVAKDQLNAATLERSINYVMERQQKREELFKAKRVVQALCECNNAVIHIKDEVELAREICRIVVEVGGYRMAWVGYAEQTADRMVTPVAHYGYEQGYLETVKVTWHDAERGRGPTGTAIRTGVPNIVRSVQSHPELAPWSTNAAKQGYASVIGLPLFLGGEMLGALTIYAPEPDSFGTEEVQLLEKLSGNLSHGIAALRAHRARMQAEESLKEAFVDLERRVEERTIELVRTNAELTREIAERKVTEEELHRSEACIMGVLNSLSSHVAVLDDKGAIVAVNEAWRSFARKNGAQNINSFVGTNYLTVCEGIIPGERDETAEVALRGIRAVMDRSLTDFVFEYPCHSPGVQRWFSMHVSPLSTHRHGVVISHLNITARKQAEESLRESRNFVQKVLETTPSLIYIHDLVEKRNVYANRQALDFLGCTPAQILAMGPALLSNVLHPDDAERVAQHFARLAETSDNQVLEIEYRLKNAGGQWRWLSSRDVGFVRNSQGITTMILGSARDITEEKRAAEQQETLEARLRQAQKMEAIGTLAGGIAHDFNNILGAILGFTDLAMDDIPEGAPARQDLAQVLKAAHRAKDLVGQILAFSRQRDSQERRPVEMGHIVKEALKLLRATLPTTIQLRRKITKDAASVLADPTQVHQIVMNLCANAAHAMREKGGVLEVGLSEVELDDKAAASYPGLGPGNYLRLSVRDTGHGMDRATLERIFDPYFTTKIVGEGSGLGLAVVHGIVKRHEGAVTATSEPGKGTTFHVLLPRIETAQAAQDETLGLIQGGSEHILFVDDEDSLAAMAKKMLELLGYRVTATTDSLEAIELFRAQPDAFDIIVTDYTMPHMTGVDLAGEVLRIRPSIPIILCTGFSENITAEKARELGVREFIMKPLSKRAIAAVIRKALDT